MLRVCGISGAELASLAGVELTEELRDVRGLKLHLRKLHGFRVCLQELLDGSRMLEDAVKLEVPGDLQLLLKTSLAGKEAVHAGTLEFMHAASNGLGHCAIACGSWC